LQWSIHCKHFRHCLLFDLDLSCIILRTRSISCGSKLAKLRSRWFEKYSKYNWNYQKSDSANISRLIRESPQYFRLLDGDFIMTIDFRHSHFHQNLEFSENQRHVARLILYSNWSSIPKLNHMYVHWLLNELRSDSYKYILKSGQRTNNFRHEL
jgi:hypothetical protein